MLRSFQVALGDFFRFKPLKSLQSFWWFSTDYRKYKTLGKNQNFRLSASYLMPCLLDKTASTPVEPVYFHQMCWTAEKIFNLRPAKHIDVGSHVGSLGIMSKLVPIEFVDIRPINVSIPTLTFSAGTIVDLPYADDSLESVSSVCVIEHIGLGRYGDPIDPFGSEKAAHELERITRVGGHLIITVPVDSISKVYFNAHRAFTKMYVLSLFSKCELVEERYIYGNNLEEHYQPEKGFGTGLFLFKKTKATKPSSG